MSRAPFFKWFPSDFLGDTMGLSDAEVGTYVLLLMSMWNAGGYLPADHSRLARMGRCSAKIWPRRWAAITRFFTEENGSITNERLLSERQKVESISAERSSAGKRGVEAKALKSLEAASANASANRKQPEPEPELPPVGGVGALAETPDKRAWREAVALLTGRGMKDAQARAYFGKLLRDHGLSPHQMLPSVVGASLKTDDPAPYLAAVAKRLAAQPKGEPPANVDAWTEETWAVAYRRFRDLGAWDIASMGPTPGQPGCRVPASVILEAA